MFIFRFDIKEKVGGGGYGAEIFEILKSWQAKKKPISQIFKILIRGKKGGSEVPI